MTTSRTRTFLRAAAGVVLGYAGMVVLASGTTAVLRSLFAVARSEHPPVWYQGVDLGYSLIYMGCGGAIAAAVAGHRRSAIVLAVAFLVLGIVGAAGGLDTTHALTYQWIVTIVGPVAVLSGGLMVGRRVAGPAMADPAGR